MGLKDFINRILGKTEEAGKKAGEFSEKIGADFKERSGPFVDKLEATAEDLGKQVIDTGKTLRDKASQLADEMGSRILHGEDEEQSEYDSAIDSDPLSEDEPVRRASKTPPKAPKSSEEPFTPKEDPFKKYEDAHTKSSHMEELTRDDPFRSSDSFFDKASRYADGDYHDKPKTEENADQEPPKHKQPWTDPVAGFEDSDGDGDPVIDDAIIEEEE